MKEVEIKIQIIYTEKVMQIGQDLETQSLYMI
jgi:hypothetical protein